MLKSMAIKFDGNNNISMNLEEDIKRLKKDMNAVILAHYYQEPEIQDIADFIGDSLDLSRKAAATDADVIVFCGVKFMAEVAHILSPEKLVIIPDLDAGCSLEQSCQASKFAEFRKQYPDHISLTYINCSAEVKALSDIIVTSSNAEYIINNIPKDQPILFAPDKYLGSYLQKKTGRDMVLWDGTCIVHENFSEKEVIKLKTRHPDAYVIAHPECPERLLRYADHVGSTSSLLKYTADNAGSKFIVLTEEGIIHQMKTLSAGSEFYSVAGASDQGSCSFCNTCPYMKLNTLEKLYNAMLNKAPVITLPEDVRVKAVSSLDKMLELSPPAAVSKGNESKSRV